MVLKMKYKNTVFITILIGLMFVMVFATQTSYPVQAKTTRDVIKIGGLGPLAITPGQDMKRGMDLAISEINVDGVTVSGTAYDLQASYQTTSGGDGLPDSGTAATSLTALKGDGVVAVVGGFRTEVVVSIESQLGQLPFVGVGSTAPLITPYMWRVGPTNGTELAYSLIEFYHVYMVKLGIRNVTIVREQADWSLAISKGIKGAFAAYFPMDNVTFGTDIPISTSASQDSVTSSLTPLKDSSTDAILELFSAPVGQFVTQAWSSLNLTQMLAGINVEAQKSTYFGDTAGAAYGEIQLETTSPDDTSNAKGQAFREAYMKEYSVEPTYTAYASYDAVYVLKQALEKSSSATSEQIQTNLATTDYNGTAFRIKFTSEPGSQLGVNSTGDKVPIPGAPTGITVHDLYTPDGIGTSGQGFANPVFVQWQKTGIKKTVYSTVDNFVANGASALQWPINHADHGYTNTKSSPGFEFIPIFSLIVVIAIVQNYKRNKI
jgi:branched-chain amino acid transport system substrate-binding protein